jgi:hypothetical protein
LAAKRKTFDDVFGLDSEYVKAGAKIDYGDLGHFVLLPMGPENENLSKVANRIYAPYRRQMDTDTLSEEVSRKLAVRIFAEAIISEMAYNQEDGTVLEDTIDNRVAVLERLPQLFLKLTEDAQKRGNFQRANVEADAKN